jgi:hypothetical protein
MSHGWDFGWVRRIHSQRQDLQWQFPENNRDERLQVAEERRKCVRNVAVSGVC